MLLARTRSSSPVTVVTVHARGTVIARRPLPLHPLTAVIAVTGVTGATSVTAATTEDEAR